MTLTQRVSAASVVGDYQVPMPKIFDDPVGPRTGRNHPEVSHQAGDRSQKNIHAVRNNILVLIRENPGINGAELNDLYRDTFKRRNWVRTAYDSPRKRAFEMAEPDSGLVLIQPPRDGGRTFIISAAGLDVIA